MPKNYIEKHKKYSLIKTYRFIAEAVNESK